MDKLFQVLEFVTSFLVVATLYLLPRSHKWWLAYAGNSVLFSGVSLYWDRPWFALMGFILFITAVKNYIVEERKLEEEKGSDENKDPIS